MQNSQAPNSRRAAKFNLIAGVLCLDFVNTLDDRYSESPNELLTQYVDVARFAEDTGALDAHQVDRLFTLSRQLPKEAERALEAARQLREAIYAVVWAIVTRKPVPEAALYTLNQYVQVAAQHAKLIEHKRRFAWGFEETSPDLQAPLWPIARSAAELLASARLALVRACSSKACQWLFLDSSKAHRRRWCDMAVCGNRAKNKRHYARSKKA